MWKVSDGLPRTSIHCYRAANQYELGIVTMMFGLYYITTSVSWKTNNLYRISNVRFRQIAGLDCVAVN